MIYEYELNKQDYIDFNLSHISSSPSLRRSVMIQRFIAPVIFLIFPLFLADVSDISLREWYVVYGILFVLWVIFHPKYIKRRVIKRTTKLLEEGNAEELFGKHVFQITEDGLVELTKNSEVKCKRIEKIIETDQHIFIYVSAQAAFIIPKRLFESNGDKESFLKNIEKFKEY